MTSSQPTITLPDRLLTRAEAAHFLGVAESTLEVWACTGRYGLPVTKVGRLSKYRLSKLMEFIERRTSAGGEEVLPVAESQCHATA
jgi:Helix-turn-helix domain